ncbi:MAG: hypothetical protein CHACPFDD_04157 [Phycisphaerae bacterium]|nr:hypothetical protein [Phycisphaerae bacterium]
MKRDDVTDLPIGWALARVGEIADVNPRFDRNGIADDATVSFVPMAAVEEESGRIDTSQTRPFAEVRKGYTPFLRGDVLLAKITPCMENGKLAVAPELTGGVGFGSTEFHVLRSRDPIRSAWFFYFLLQRSFRREARRQMTGSAGQLRVPADFVAATQIPIAPIAEQDRIVAEIEKQFTRLDAGVAALKRVEANLRRYKAAVLKAACDGSLSAPWRAAHADVEPAEKLLSRILRERRRRWEEAELAKLVAKDKPPKDDRWKQRYKEPAPPRTAGLAELPPTWCWATVEQLTPFDRPAAYGVLQPGSDIDGGIEFVRVCDIWEGAILRDQLKRISPAIAARYPRTKLEGGEVLVTIVGTIGRSAVVPAELAGANTARAVAVLPIAQPIEARYVEICFRNPAKARELTGKAHEVARKTLNLEDVRATCIPLPPQDEQAVIAEMVDDTWTIVQSVEQTVEVNLKRADRLRQSILKAAFEGRLVAQDPSDVPAAVLLERIRAERDAGERRTTRRTRPRRRVRHG